MQQGSVKPPVIVGCNYGWKITNENININYIIKYNSTEIANFHPKRNRDQFAFAIQLTKHLTEIFQKGVGNIKC